MNGRCSQLVDSYLAWIRDKFTVEDIVGVCEITTPFLDRHNDRLQIYAVPKNGILRLTDDGYIVADLKASGCPIDTAGRQATLRVILNGFGVHEEDGELYVDASPANFPQKKHALIQAMLAVNDMFTTARQRVATLFFEDVSQFLEANDVRHAANVEFTGKSGFIHKFDFLIPKSRKMPERLVRAINNPTRDSATSLLFSWTDTREVRAPDSRVYAILNDTDKPTSQDLLSALEEYDVKAVLWSQRQQYLAELAA
jgi:hypothetical protein